jgi:hypothetical protein
MNQANKARVAAEFAESYRTSRTSFNEVPSNFPEQCCDTVGGAYSYDPLQERDTETATFDPRDVGVSHL